MTLQGVNLLRSIYALSVLPAQYRSYDEEGMFGEFTWERLRGWGTLWKKWCDHFETEGHRGVAPPQINKIWDRIL